MKQQLEQIKQQELIHHRAMKQQLEQIKQQELIHNRAMKQQLEQLKQQEVIHESTWQLESGISFGFLSGRLGFNIPVSISRQQRTIKRVAQKPSKQQAYLLGMN